MKLLIILFFAPALFAQPDSNPFSSDSRLQYAQIKSSVLRAAKEMPEEYYSFRSVPEVRTYGQMIAHIADAGLRMCATVKGEKVTANASTKKSKEELIAALKASFDYCDPVYAAMTDQAGTAKVHWAVWELTKLGLLNWNVVHDNEMFGILGAFLRLKGLVPPSFSEAP